MSESAGTRTAFGVLAGLLRPVMNLVLAKKWEGTEKLPKGQGFIVCANHCTEIDPIVVGHMLYNQGSMPHFLAKAGLFKVPVVGSALRWARQIPVERSSGSANDSLRVAQDVMDDGGSIVIYPEGTLTRDPDLWPMKGHTGAARLALQTGAPVIPVAHWGAQELFPRYAKRLHLFPRKRVRVLVGDPVDLSAFSDRSLDKATLIEATDVILDAVTALLAQLRGETPPAVRWDPSAHNQSKHGRYIQRGSNDQPPAAGGTLPGAGA